MTITPNDDTLANTCEDVTNRGYAVLRTVPTRAALTATAVRYGGATGARSIGVKELDDTGSTEWLARHTESVTCPTFLRYFALGCLIPATSQGATCLYDGRIAARTLLDTVPEVEAMRIRYATVYRPNEAMVHPLIVDDPTYGPVLRYRSALDTNTMLGPLPAGLSEAELYEKIEAALTTAFTVAHLWQAGDVLVVNNTTMIHARQPFVGRRHMLRFRYDDPNFRTITIRRHEIHPAACGHTPAAGRDPTSVLAARRASHVRGKSPHHPSR